MERDLPFFGADSARRSILFPLSLAAALPGCTYLQAQSRVDPQTVAVYSRGYTQDAETAGASDVPCPRKLPDDNHGGAVNLDCFHFPEYRGVGKTAYQLAAASRSDALPRNRLAAILMKHSDDICTVEMGRLVADEAITNTALSTLTSGFSAAASVVTGETAKSILAGVATTTSATRAHIDAEIYRNALSTAISRAIDHEREDRRKAIEAKYTQSPAQYTVDQMIFDVNEYHQSCSFYHGIALINEAVDRQSADSPDRQRLTDLAVKAIDDRIAELERQLSAKGVSAENAAAIRTQITALRTEQTAKMTTLPLLPPPHPATQQGQ